MQNIFNYMWKYYKFPTEWNEALVIPVPKAGKDPSKIASFRPIALTNCLCKLFERIICKRLDWFLETQNIINENQHGFRASHSTNDCLVFLEKEITDAFKNKMHSLAVCLDIEKCYNMLWKNRIIKTLLNIGLKGSIVHFVKNFLGNRTIHVRINGHYSRIHKIENGVPQGSPISVKLFITTIMMQLVHQNLQILHLNF